MVHRSVRPYRARQGRTREGALSEPDTRGASHRSQSIASRVAARVAQGIFVVFFASTFTWLLLHFAPGDPFTAQHEQATPQVIAEWRERQGLDRPLPVQYALWITGVAKGDFGWSSSQNRPVSTIIAGALPNTLQLMTLAFASSLIFGVLLGAWQGARVGSRGDRAVSMLSLFAYSLPEFWLALALMLVFVSALGWLPATGMTSEMYDYMSNPLDRLADRARHLVLPWLSLTIVGTAIFARYQRSAMSDSWDQPFVRTARAKGLGERGVRRHALRASLLPVLTIAGLLFPALLMGAVFVERIFAWPGMGSLLFNAVTQRDYMLVAAMVVVGSAMTTIGSALADIARVVADPRARRT